MAAHKRVHTAAAIRKKMLKASGASNKPLGTAMAAAVALEDICDELQCPMCLELFQEPILLSYRRARIISV